MSQQSYGTPKHWLDVLVSEFTKETDRAAVILVVALFDHALATLLRRHLVPSTSGDDELLDQPNAPLSTFSARIHLTRRLGLISTKYARDLHLIRKIRNEFAHNIHGCSFEASSVRARIVELAKSSGMIERHPKKRALAGAGPRGDFLLTAAWMLYALNQKIEHSSALAEASDEWGYNTQLSEKNDDMT